MNSQRNEKQEMGDLKRYVADRRRRDPSFNEGFDNGYEQFKIGVLLRQAREEAGLTQEQLALRIGSKKTAVSRIENHADDIKLSTLERYAHALGKTLYVRVA